MAASVRSEADRAANTASLIAMWVAPHARGSGAASLLVEAIQAALRADGVGTLLLEVAPDNARAVAFYRRHGFAFQAHRERLASHPHIEVQRMALPLACARLNRLCPAPCRRRRARDNKANLPYHCSTST